MGGFKEFKGGKGGAADRVRFGQFHLTLPKQMPGCSRVKVFFDEETRCMAFKPTEEGGFALSGNRQMSCRSLMNRFEIPNGTIVAAEWDADEGMLITEPVPQEN